VIRRIICLGNSLVGSDTAGPAVYEYLQGIDLPAGVEVIEGGLAGLSLLPYLEQGGRVIFVDAISGFATKGSVVVLDQHAVTATLGDSHYDHESGLPYLLSVLPRVCDGELPEEIFLVGVEAEFDTRVIERAAELSLFIAVNGYQETG
jgi:hydrogenase maturation protease